MSFLHALGNTGITVSALGLGTVKFGRNTGVKYPAAFELPTDAAIRDLLAVARELGINTLDTAPAYGSSEERLGQLLTNRNDWVVITKVGEEYDGTDSSFDFGAKHVRHSVERSLKRLRTDHLDVVLIHSDGNDEQILRHTDCIATLRELQQQGLIRAIGMSTKTDAGGLLAAELLDVVMVTYNLQQQDRGVVERAHALNKGVLVKKGLMSGHVHNGATPQDPVQQSMRLILGTPGIHCMIVGTLNTDHLRSNVAAAVGARHGVPN
ncbi:MAG TPA: aldo/keto reductase [Candidatus Acidoferrum sp.]|nr:aldo/keto reductase [Candidatus Acidoferrum sp.]